mgnify:CR=1 FL=1
MNNSVQGLVITIKSPTLHERDMVMNHVRYLIESLTRAGRVGTVEVMALPNQQLISTELQGEQL